MAIPSLCKRLIEVDFPIAAVGRHAAREKSIRQGHPSTLHLWWARRPLAACRAVLMGLLMPDPVDPLCPPKFKEDARNIFSGIEGIGPKTDLDLRKALLNFIADFANWDNSSDEVYLKRARNLIHAAHPDETPLVVDPFAGGGSIPLEALRVGCEAFASDLNPVACLILKVMLEDIPRYGPKLADELRKVGMEIKATAEKEFADFYPVDPDGARPIAYLWARTVRCETPNCGAEIPLARSFWLCTKNSRKRALNWKIKRVKGKTPEIEFEIFEPKKENEVPLGTVKHADATCPACGTVLPSERVREYLSKYQGGADVLFDKKGSRVGGARLLAVVTLKAGEIGRKYRLPKDEDYRAVWDAQKYLKKMMTKPHPGELNLIPDELIRTDKRGNFWVTQYGPKSWGDLFTARQKMNLVFLVKECNSRSQNISKLSLTAVISRCADYWSAGVIWAQGGEFVAHTFGRQALPMVWDFAEAVPWVNASGNFEGALDWVIAVINAWPKSKHIGDVKQADASDTLLPESSANIWFTDPPYYDAIAYSGLSDFFFVWIKRANPHDTLFRDPYDRSNLLTPHNRECAVDWTIASDGIMKDNAYYEQKISKAFQEGRKCLKEDGIGCIVFAHKTTEGWEALLSGIINGGWVINGSWPITTERPGRLRSQESAALASSVHLIIRPRSQNAPVGGWEEIVQELPHKIWEWIERLSGQGIRGADLVFSCIGPSMELYSRHPRVETADGREIKLSEYLTKVWEVLGRVALQRVLGGSNKDDVAGTLEEDARLTALFLWTLQSTAPGTGGKISTSSSTAIDNIGKEDINNEDEDLDASKSKGKAKCGYSLQFDIARRFAQPLGIHLEEWKGRVIEIEKGIVRLIPITERASILFGKDGAEQVAKGIEERQEKTIQTKLFTLEHEGAAPEIQPENRTKKQGRGKGPSIVREATTLDHLHAAMLLQRAGQSAALKVLLEEALARGPEFERLANALSALYPVGSEEKRLLDAMLLAIPKK